MDESIVKHFESVDPIMSSLYRNYSGKILNRDSRHKTHYLEDLCESIISQQLSVKAAHTIFTRASVLVSDWNSADAILLVSTEKLRAAGLSYAKISYIRNLAQHVKDNKLPVQSLDELDDGSIITLLCEVKGIGRWTAEMFLMCSMARPDVFSYGDQGLKNAVLMHYGQVISSPKMKHIVESWSPFRTTAARVLWKSLDNEPLSS